MVQLNVPGVREEIEEDVLNGSPHRLSQGVFPFCQEVLDISQIAIAFHRISPPFFIQSCL